MGARLQGGESDILEQDTCEMSGETLQEQVDRYGIRYTFGDEEPLAYVQASPVAYPNLDRERQADRHLAGLGVRLSKADALARYGRTEAMDDEDALEAPKPAPQGGPWGAANEKPDATAGKQARGAVARPLQNARTGSDGETPPPEGAGASTGLLRAFAEDTAPAAAKIKSLLERLDAGEDIREEARKVADECQRFGRREVEGSGEDRAMRAPQQPAAGDGRPPMGGRGLGLWNEDTAGEPPAPPAERRLAKAMQRDLRPVARAIADGLKKRDWDALRKRLDGALKECGTESAEELAGAMVGAGEKAWPTGEDLATKNAKDAEGVEKGNMALANDIANPCPNCHRNMPKDGPCSFCAKRTANHEAGKAAFSEVAKTHKDKIGAMERDSIGKIDFIWGDESEGICHIMGKHEPDAQMIPGVIAYGDVYEDAVNGKYYIVKKRNLVILRKRTGANHYLITGYKKDGPDAIAKIRKENRLVEKGE